MRNFEIEKDIDGRYSIFCTDREGKTRYDKWTYLFQDGTVHYHDLRDEEDRKIVYYDTREDAISTLKEYYDSFEFIKPEDFTI